MKQCFKIIFKAKFNKFYQRKSILVILSFILVTLTIYLHNQKKITKTTTATSRNQLQSVFNTLKQNEAILLDIELINVIKSNDEFTKLDKSAQSVLINDNFKKIEQYQTEHKSTLITFGVRFNSFEKLDNVGYFYYLLYFKIMLIFSPNFEGITKKSWFKFDYNL